MSGRRQSADSTRQITSDVEHSRLFNNECLEIKHGQHQTHAICIRLNSKH